MLGIHMILGCLKRNCSIFALSSGAFPAAISIVRISGKESRRCLEELTGMKKIKPRELFFANIRYKGELIDRGMAVYIPGPNTSTGEDVAEFHVHGSRAVVDYLLDSLAQFDNVRPAKAGEFTKRAFYNGKMTLHEVHSLAHLLAAQTERQRRLALRSDNLGEAMREIRRQLIEARAFVEASIDFGDDVEVQWRMIHFAIKSMIKGLLAIKERMHRGTLINDGLKIVILGQTNVGKSSLFNRIVHRDVAMVSDVEGTTRDFLEANLHISSIPVIITDTAGIRSVPLDSLEAEGIRRTLKRAKEADIILAVVDSALCKDVEAQVNFVLTSCSLREETRVVVVLNKCDLQNVLPDLHLRWPTVYVSCISGTGLNSLLEVIAKTIDELCPMLNDNALLSNQRHRVLVNDTLSVLQKALQTKDVAIVAEMLRESSDSIGEVSGTVVNEQILDQIFSSFCIGK